MNNSGDEDKVMRKAGAEPVTASRVPRMLTSAEVARLLGVNPSTLCRWRQEGKGPRVYWLGVASPRYREDDVLEWLERVVA